ncbi:xanthine dehydrogenase family protein molybdopterin-binding subunit [Phenylobacterium terrae]|uniref:Xanthine dehydrogenase family protein molybdopterin-binding subunit n=1 Tax=Phenylobacterium terrae TaxID=2665495 RepID=A0ABW4N662_9CAUL
MSVGKPISRVEGRRKVTGGALYAADNMPPGLLYGVLVGSPVAAGRIVAVRTEAALQLTGVVRVLTARDMPRFGAVTAPAAVLRLPLQSDVVEYEDEPVAIVLGETLEAAEAGAARVRVEAEAVPALVPGHGGLSTAPGEAGLGAPMRKGDLQAGLKAARHRVVQEYSQPGRHHNPIEPSATVAWWQGGKVTLWDSVQRGTNVPLVIGQALGVPSADVRVIAPHTGGGFGCKGYVWPHEVLTAAAAKVVDRPVKIVLSRAQMYSMLTYQGFIRQEVDVGCDAQGRLTALRHGVVTTTPISETFSEPATEISKNLYACPAIWTSQAVERANVNLNNAMRAPVEGPGSWALESAMDELSHAAGIDPLDLRLANFAKVDPQHGKPWSSNKLREAYAEGARLYGWRGRAARPRQDGPWRIGHGMAACTMGNFRFPATARVRLAPPGRAVVEANTHDIGTGTQTVFVQIAAEALGLDASEVSIRWGDTNLPDAGPVHGSAATMCTGAAVQAAAADARRRLAEALGANADELDVRAALRRASAEVVGEGRFRLPGNAPFDADGGTSPYAMRTWGAVFVEVGIDEDFGIIRLRRAVGAYSAGRIINPKTARSQMTGGIIWGWGKAAMEGTPFEPTHARWLAKNLSNVSIPVNADIPADIQIHFVDEFDPHASPTGARGIGELASTGVAAAVANAVFDAVGVRVRHLPITPATLLKRLAAPA